MLSWSLEGEQPFTTTALASALTAAATLVPVSSVEAFSDADYLFIEGETIQYSGTDTGAAKCSGAAACFTGATRASRGSSASSHASGVRVYSRALGPINQAAAFTVKEIGVFDLKIEIPWISPGVVAGFVAKSITWDFVFLDGSFQIIRVVLSAMSIGFVFFLFARLAPVFISAGSMIRDFFRI